MSSGKFAISLYSHTYEYTYAVQPVVDITSPISGLTNDNSPLLSYTASEGTVTVMVDGTVVPKTSGDQLDILPDGSHRVRVEASSFGLTGAGEIDFTVDTVKPVITPSRNSGILAEPFFLTFNVNELSVIKYTTDGSDPSVSGTVYDSPIPITVGTAVYAVATDLAGNKSDNYYFSYVPVQPVVEITSPVSGLTNDNSPLLSYTASEGTVTVMVDGTVVSKTSDDQLDILPDGSHRVRVEASSFGLTGAGEIDFTVDTVKPVITPSRNSGILAEPFFLTFNVNEPSVIKYTTDGSDPSVSGTVYDSPIPITVGTAVYAVATDLAGNKSNIYHFSYAVSSGQNNTGEPGKKDTDGSGEESAGSSTGGSLPGVSVQQPPSPVSTVHHTLEGENISATLKPLEKKVPEAEAKSNTTDVSPRHWAKDSISTAVSAQLFSGTGKGFEPDRAITRAELITVLMNCLEVDSSPVSNLGYSDSRNIPSWAVQKIVEAKALGLVNGYPDGTLRPNNEITREEASVMFNIFARAFLNLKSREVSNSLRDNTSNWSKENIDTLVQGGLIKGYPDGNFRPASPITRAEFAVLIVKFYERLPNGK